MSYSLRFRQHWVSLSSTVFIIIIFLVYIGEVSCHDSYDDGIGSSLLSSYDVSNVSSDEKGKIKM